MSKTIDEKSTLSGKEFALLSVSTLSVMAGATIAPALPEIAKAFPSETELTIQLILIMPALFAAIGSLFVGNLIDRFGRINLLVISIVIYGLFGSTGLYLNNLNLLLVGRAILGLSVAAIMTIATTLIGDYYHGDFREKMIGIQSAFMTFAGAFFIFFGGVLANLDWHAPFGIYLLAFVILFFVLRLMDEPEVIKIDHSPGHVTTHEESLAVHAKILLFAYGMVFLAATTLTFMIIFIPFYMEEIFNRSPVEIGIAISLNTLFAGFAALFYKRLIEKLNYMKVFAIVLIIMGIGNLIIGSTNEYVVLILGLILIGIAFGWFVPNITGWLFGHIHGPIRSRAIGGFTFALFTGQFTSPILGNLIRGNNPISYIFTFTGIFLLAISIFFIARSFTPEKEHSTNGN